MTLLAGLFEMRGCWHIGLRWAIVALWATCYTKSETKMQSVLNEDICLFVCVYESRHDETCLWYICEQQRRRSAFHWALIWVLPGGKPSKTGVLVKWPIWWLNYPQHFKVHASYGWHCDYKGRFVTLGLAGYVCDKHIRSSPDGKTFWRVVTERLGQFWSRRQTFWSAGEYVSKSWLYYW